MGPGMILRNSEQCSNSIWFEGIESVRARALREESPQGALPSVEVVMWPAVDFRQGPEREGKKRGRNREREPT